MTILEFAETMDNKNYCSSNCYEIFPGSDAPERFSVVFLQYRTQESDVPLSRVEFMVSESVYNTYMKNGYLKGRRYKDFQLVDRLKLLNYMCNYFVEDQNE